MSLTYALRRVSLSTLAVFASPISAVALHNYTIALPPGSSDHGTPGLICTPTKPIDVLTFYLFNYVAHAATVLTRPGERADDYLVSVIGSLLFPALGLYRGIEAILCGAVFARDDDLRKAARSGALCLVVRGADWRPADGEVVSNVVLKRGNMLASDEHTDRSDTNDSQPEKDDLQVHVLPYSPPYMNNKFGNPAFVHRRNIHGVYNLPKGYRFAILPNDAQFQVPLSDSAVDQPTIEVAAMYNIVKALIALVQSAYALVTLYRARGDQITQFGYAAFGLTVAPYAVMSIINLIGNLCRPEYPSLYMVESSVMDEARGRGGLFEGAVGRVQEDTAVRVCSCGFADGEDLEDLHFTANESGEVEAHFSTITQKSYSTHREDSETNTTRSLSTTKEAAVSPHASTVRTTMLTCSITALPDQLNYINTETDTLLLIPCHTPILRSPPYPNSPSITQPPTRHAISAITLQRTWWFKRHYTWALRYHPSHLTIRAHRWRTAKYALTALISLLPLLVVGVMSRFQIGAIPPRESNTWRGFTVQWLCIGSFTGLWWVVDQEAKDAMPSARAQIGPLIRGVMYVVSASPAVGGFVVVAQMLFWYGVCVWVGD